MKKVLPLGLLSCGCHCSVALPHGSWGWSTVCDIVVFPDLTHFFQNKK